MSSSRSVPQTTVAAVELQALTFTRRQGFVLGPLHLSVETGGRLALVGPSGAGKTTVLRLIAGLETPTSGRVTLAGVLAADPKPRLPSHARNIGFVFQQGSLWPHLTALKHLRFCAPDANEADLVALLGSVGLAGKEERRPGQLSGGEAQRLSLARALSGNPRLLLLDEPLHSVDVPLRDELALLIRRVADERGLTLVVVTHDRAEALAMADSIAVLRDGQVVEQGQAADLLRAPATAYTASFLAHAACWPLTRRADGQLETPFGTYPAPADMAPDPTLVVLPGDAVVATPVGKEGDLHRASGHVLQSEPSGLDYLLHIVVAGRTVRVPNPAPLAPGAAVSIVLRDAPRILGQGEPVR